MKITLPFHAIHLLIWAALLTFGHPFPSTAQEPVPIPKITPLWTSTQKFCSPDIYCGQIWHLSADGEHLFVYIVPTFSMYVFSKGIDKVAIYPIPQLSQATNFSFDYFPLNDHIIFYSDRLNKGALTRLDLLTGENHVFGNEIFLEDCRNQLLQFDRASDFFHYLPTFHALLICRKTHYDDVYSPNFISIVDLKSGQLTDVAYLGDTVYRYINVIGGRNGGIYLEPGPSNISNGTRLITRWNVSRSTWDRIEFQETNLDNNDYRSPGFVGVDKQSNLYFESDFDADRKPRLIITKVNPTTKVAQVIKEDQLGWKPYFVGLDYSGKMIILNQITLPSSNTTVDVISQYDFESPPT
jgi:hypothetical protein